MTFFKNVFALLFSTPSFLLFITLTGFSAPAQNSAEVKLLLAEKYYENDVIDSLIFVSHDILRSVDPQKDRTIVAKAYYYLGHASETEGFQDSVLYYYGNAINEYETLGDSAWVGQLLVRKGFLFRQRQQIDTALYYYNAALPYLDQARDTLWIGYANDHLGYMLVRKGDYYRALMHYQTAITAFKSLNILMNVGAEYNAIGMIYRQTNDTDKEKQAYREAIEILENFGENKYLGEACSNLSEILLMEGQIEEGFRLLSRAKTIFENIDHQLGLYSYNAVLSYYYQNTNPPDYHKVMEYGKKSADIAYKIESYREFADACYYVGNAYINLKNFVQAGKWLQKGYRAATQYQHPTELARLSNELANYYSLLGEYDDAYRYLRQYNDLNDSLASNEKIKEFTSLDLSHTYRQNKLRDSLLQVNEKQNLIFEHKRELQQEQTIQLILIFSVLILVLIGGFIYFTSKRTRKQAIELDEKNKIINKSLHEKELLLKEIHHRVKNNFQIISSLLQLQFKGIEDDQVFKNVEEGQNRIQSMALIHQKLYQNEDLSVIEMQDYTEQLLKQITTFYGFRNLHLQVQAHNLTLDIDTAIPLGLILNELITNSCKYAFADSDQGKIHIELEQTETHYKLFFTDSGPGLPRGLDIDKSKSLGLRLVKRLSKQLHGYFEYNRDHPAKFIITFKDGDQRKELD